MSKMNTVLAVADQKATRYNKMLSDYFSFFKSNQGAFKGIKNTFTPREGFADQPERRSNTKVVTTVDEKFDWFIGEAKSYMDDAFSIDATNSIGAKKVDLIINGVSYGKLSAIELMRLKNFITNTTLDNLCNIIPVRSETENWTKSGSDEYSSREIYETEVLKGTTKTTIKSARILPDPNIDKLKDSSRYTPQVIQDEKQEETGDYTNQKFSGEWSHVKRAELLKRKSDILDAIVKALKEVNDIESVESELDSEKLLKYLFRGNK